MDNYMISLKVCIHNWGHFCIPFIKRAVFHLKVRSVQVDILTGR